MESGGRNFVGKKDPQKSLAESAFRSLDIIDESSLRLSLCSDCVHMCLPFLRAVFFSHRSRHTHVSSVASSVGSCANASRNDKLEDLAADNYLSPPF
jgi:hypothetical protein